MVFLSFVSDALVVRCCTLILQKRSVVKVYFKNENELPVFIPDGLIILPKTVIKLVLTENIGRPRFALHREFSKDSHLALKLILVFINSTAFEN